MSQALGSEAMDTIVNFGQVCFFNSESGMGPNPNMREESGREIKDQNKVRHFARKKGRGEVDVQLT